jgi:hypothetical protein
MAGTWLLLLAERHATTEKCEYYKDYFKLPLLHPTPPSRNDEAQHGLLTENQYEIHPLPELSRISSRLHLMPEPDPKDLRSIPMNPKLF